MAKSVIRRKIYPENPVKVGARFCRLTVVEDGWEQVSPTGYKNDMVKVRCDCGGEKFVRPRSLTSGKTMSCGCLAKERATELCLSRVKHGYARVAPSDDRRVYRAYHGMLNRCYNPNAGKYDDYGGRGIYVCDSWRGEGGFERFISDMGPKPKGCSIERIDNDGPYSADNCRWATTREQCNNRRSNVVLSYGGKTQTLTQWCTELGMKFSTVYDRLKRGWPVERALSEPPS